jgi:outer membrane receptor protein involved in Fe transport
LNFNADCFFWDGGERSDPEDTRDDPSGHALVFATLIARKFVKGHEDLELRASVYNLLDKDYTSPMAPRTAGFPPRLPNDLPMPGINYLLELKYMF